MSESNRFLARLEKAIRTQLNSQKVGFLLGAGASFLNGSGYPLASDIWNEIKDEIPNKEKDEIQAKLDIEGTAGIEHALDLLDPGGPEPTPHRTFVTTAIASYFSKIEPPIDQHCHFVKNIAKRNDSFIPIFTLNYDPLIELAADEETIPVTDGFSGFYKSSFDPNNFDIVPSKYFFTIDIRN